MTTKTLPVKGTVWLHARRKNIDGEPLQLTVTSITRGKVYSRTEFGSRVKTPVETFDQFCREIVSVPEKSARPSAPKLSRSESMALYAKADAAGRAAADACVPQPMYVVQRANPLDDNSPIVKAYAPVMSGVCGYAWINISPGNSTFARYLKEQGLGDRDNYYGGVSVRVYGYGQSYEKKAAYAGAFAKVLQEAGIRAQSMSRLD